MKYTYQLLAFSCWLLASCLSQNSASAQTKIVGKNEDGSLQSTTPYTPDPSAVLELESTNKGFLLPRLSTTQRNSITTPVNGLTIYNTNTKAIECYNGTTWTASTISPLTLSGTAPITITGSYPNLTVAHATSDGNLHVPATGTTNNSKVLTAGSTAGNISWQPIFFENLADPATVSTHWIASNSFFRVPIFNTGWNGVGWYTKVSLGVYCSGNSELQQAVISVANSDGSASQDFFFTQTGNIRMQGSVVSSSDIRLKRNIVPLKYGLKDILQIDPISFSWKADSLNKTKLGVSAQQIQTILPEVVNVDSDKDKTLGVMYSDMIPVLINAIKEQQVMIEELKKKIEDVK